MEEWITELLGEVWWRRWWAWGMVAAVFGILEMLAPGYIFLGFAIGASALAAVLLIGDPVAAWLPEGLPALTVVFAVFSILAWVLVRALVGVRSGQKRIIHHDINED